MTFELPVLMRLRADGEADSDVAAIFDDRSVDDSCDSDDDVDDFADMWWW
jgi:hypothetical protein